MVDGFFVVRFCIFMYVYVYVCYYWEVGLGKFLFGYWNYNKLKINVIFVNVFLSKLCLNWNLNWV